MKYFFWIIFGHQLFMTAIVFGQNGVIKPCSPPKSAECQSNQQQRDDINSKNEKTRIFGESLLPPKSSEFRTKLSNAVKEKLKLSKDEQKTFATYLQDKDVKIIKIWDNFCGDGEINIFNASLTNCGDKFDFWKASVYSFYKKDYKSFFATIAVTNNRIIAKNDINQIMADVSDVGFNNISFNSKTVSTINSYNFEQNNATKSLQLEGIKIVYSENISIDKTYLLRAVFNDDNLTSGFTKVDKTYVFQILKIENDFATIIWKEVKAKK